MSKKLTYKQKEAISFYVKSHYLIINNLMYDKKEDVEKWLSIVNEDDIAVMHEAEEQGYSKRWETNEKWGKKIYKAYQKRTAQILTHKEKQRLLEIAREDIIQLNKAMSKSLNDIILYRNVKPCNVFSEMFVGKTIKVPSFFSTSSILSETSYTKQKEFVRYVIKVPKGTPMIRVDIMDKGLSNEYMGSEGQNENEVILPPLKYNIRKISNIRQGNCITEVELEIVK